MGELQDIEVALPVGVAVGIVLADLVAAEVQLGRIVEAVGQPVAGRLPTGSVASPAPGTSFSAL